MKIYISAGEFYDDHKEEITDILIDHVDYCAEPHQLCEEDLMNNTDFDYIVEVIENQFGAEFEDGEKEMVVDWLKDDLSEIYNEDPTTFFI